MGTPDLDTGAGGRRHFDFCFVFQGDPETLTLQQDEISDSSWVSPDMAPAAIRDRLIELRLI